MGKEMNTPVGRYCLSVATSAVYYTNSETWTPNNIKRLIISPDMVVVQLHTHSSYIKKKFEVESYVKCISDSKYKPMVTVLGGSGHNVCSHTEEIIYCLSGVNGGVLHNAEADLRSILSSDKALGASDESKLVRGIGERFKRLRSISYYSGTLVEFMNTYGAKFLKDKFFHLDADTDARLKLVYVHKDDWYKGYYFRPSVYPADKEGGRLFEILHSTEKVIAERYKKATLARANKRRYGEIAIKLEKEVKAFTQIFMSISEFSLMLLKVDARSSIFHQFGVLDEDIRSLALVSDITIPKGIFKVEGKIEKRLLNFGAKMQDASNSSKEDTMKSIENLISALHTKSLVLYSNFNKLYARFITALATKYPILNKYYLDTKTLSVRFMQGVVIPEAVASKYNTNASLEKSIENMCIHMSGLLFRDSLKSKYTTAEYWGNVVKSASRPTGIVISMGGEE